LDLIVDGIQRLRFPFFICLLDRERFRNAQAVFNFYIEDGDIWYVKDISKRGENKSLFRRSRIVDQQIKSILNCLLAKSWLLLLRIPATSGHLVELIK
jgi:hypothetical protein